MDSATSSERRRCGTLNVGCAAPPALYNLGDPSPSPPPDFLWNLVALANFMRLSLKKAAYVASSSAAWQEIRVPGWAEVWRPALRASHHRRSWSVISLSTCFKQVGCSG